MNGNRPLTPQEQVTHLWLTIFGVTGSNGLHGKVREQEKDLKKFDDRLQRYDTLETQIRTVMTIGQWSVIVVATVLGLMASGTIGDFLGNLLKVGLGK